MTASHRRHDISDKTWALLEAHLPGREGVWGGHQDMSRTKGVSTQNGIWPWMRMVCRSGLLLHKVQEQVVAPGEPLDRGAIGRVSSGG